MIEQIGIAIFGTTGVILSQMRAVKARKWAPIVGLLGQVFWFWATISNRQWGMVFMSVVYSGAWMLGVYNYWFAEKRAKVGI
jgi:hypothetical protein